MSKTQLLKDTVVALGGTVDEKDVSSNDLLKKIVVTLGGTPDENSSSEDLMAQMNGLLPDAIGGSGSGSFPNIAANNPNYPNIGYGTIVTSRSIIRINLKKYAEWVKNIAENEETVVNTQLNSTYPFTATGSGTEYKAVTLFSLYPILKMSSDNDLPLYSTTFSIRFSSSYTGVFDIGTTFDPSGNNKFVSADIDLPYTNGETLENILMALDNTIDIPGSLLFERLKSMYGEGTERYNEYMRYSYFSVSGFSEIGVQVSSQSYNMNPDLNTYPVDWLEIINE